MIARLPLESASFHVRDARTWRPSHYGVVARTFDATEIAT